MNEERPQNKNLKPRKKGDPSLNPKGRPTLTEIEKKARELARHEISEIWPKYAGMTIDQLNKLDTKKLTAVELVFISALKKSIRTGDTNEFHKMYLRILGAPKGEDTNIIPGMKISQGSKMVITIASTGKTDGDRTQDRATPEAS